MKVKRATLLLGLAFITSSFSTTSLWAKPPKPGVERWPIKTSIAAHANLSHAKAIDLVELISLEDPPEVTKNDARYQSHLIPEFENPLAVKEGDIISTKGWLHLVAGES